VVWYVLAENVSGGPNKYEPIMADVSVEFTLNNTKFTLRQAVHVAVHAVVRTLAPDRIPGVGDELEHVSF
jgi:hypothetical protein